MKALLCVLVLAVSVSATLPIPEEDMQAIFTGYITRLNKVYDRSQFFYRYNVFKQSYAIILAHNALPEEKSMGVKLGTTSLADLTREEYHKLLGFKSDRHVAAGGNKHKLRSVPQPEGEFADDDSIDWVEKGAVNEVQDQGTCGSCWAFSAVAATESALFLAKGKLPKLSEQQLIDCAGHEYKGFGCAGGVMAGAYRYMLDTGGMCSETDYPYIDDDDNCHTDRLATCKKTWTPIKSYKNITCDDTDFCDKKIPKNETNMLAAVRKGVISIAIDSMSDLFQHYTSGVIDSSQCGDVLSHGVDIVGYGTDGDKPYWKVRNSWGTSWGEQGYVRLAHGKNTCGCALYTQQVYA